MAATMLIELWEKLRGYDKWVEADAKIESAKLIEVKFPRSDDLNKSKGNPIGWKSECRISWLDQNGNEHKDSFEADEESPLYQLCEGDTFRIRFDPENPAAFHVRGLLASNVTTAWKTVVWSVLLVLMATAFFAPEIFRLLARLGTK
jgi:hypothetical protein